MNAEFIADFRPVAESNREPNIVKVTDAGYTLLLHYNGNRHNSAVCRACQESRCGECGYLDRVHKGTCSRNPESAYQRAYAAGLKAGKDSAVPDDFPRRRPDGTRPTFRERAGLTSQSTGPSEATRQRYGDFWDPAPIDVGVIYMSGFKHGREGRDPRYGAAVSRAFTDGYEQGKRAPR